MTCETEGCHVYIRRYEEHLPFILPLTTSLKTPLQRKTSQQPACHAPLSHARRLPDNSSKSWKSPLTRSVHQEPKASNKKNPMYLCNLNKQALVKVLYPHHNPRSSTVCPTRASRTTSSLRNKFKPWWILSRNTPASTIRGTESIRTTAQNWTCGSSVQACSPALPTYSAASTLNRRGRPSAK